MWAAGRVGKAARWPVGIWGSAWEESLSASGVTCGEVCGERTVRKSPHGLCLHHQPVQSIRARIPWVFVSGVWGQIMRNEVSKRIPWMEGAERGCVNSGKGYTLFSQSPVLLPPAPKKYWRKLYMHWANTYLLRKDPSFESFILLKGLLMFLIPFLCPFPKKT